MKGFWVDVTLEGLNLERFLSAAGGRGLRFRRVRRPDPKRMCFLARETDLPVLTEAAAAGGWNLHAGRRHGAGRVADCVVRHWGLCLVLTAALIALFFATQVMWRIRIVDAGVYSTDIAQYLEQLGIAPVRWKREVDLALLRDRLEWRYPEVAKIDCGWRGMTLRIGMTQGTAAGDPATIAGSRDIVAARAGIIDSVVTYAGTPRVKKGDLVRQGQVLISGEERRGQNTQEPVIASGVVMARVWDSAEVRLPALERITAYTGRTEQNATLESPWFDLWAIAGPTFDQEDIAVTHVTLCSLFFPVTLRRETHMEALITTRPREWEQLQAEAGMAAMRELRRRIGFTDKVIDKWVKCSMIDDEEICAVAVGERIVDIAVPTT